MSELPPETPPSGDGKPAARGCETRPSPRAWNSRARLLWGMLWQRMGEDRTFEQAAALAYSTIFSLLPILVLALMVMSIVSSHADTKQYEQLFFNELGLSQIVARVPQQAGAVGAATQSAQSSIGSVLDTQITHVRAILQQPGTGIVGFAVLLWGAISLMLVTEQTFNQIFRVKAARTFTRRFLLYWSVLTLGPVGMAASIYFTDRFGQLVGSVSAFHVILAPAELLGGFAISWFLMALLFKLIPDTMVQFRSALIGGLATAVLWELGKFAFGLYVWHVAGYGKWYGNLGLIPIFMFWVYLTWNFILLGLEITFVHQNYRALSMRYMQGLGFVTPLVDMRCVLPLGVLLVRRFDEGKTVAVADAAQSLGLPREVAQRLLDALVDAKLAHLRHNEERNYSLARSPARITLEDLLTAASCACQTSGDSARWLETTAQDRGAPAIIAMEREQHAFARAHTLAWLAQDGAPTPLPSEVVVQAGVDGGAAHGAGPEVVDGHGNGADGDTGSDGGAAPQLAGAV